MENKAGIMVEKIGHKQTGWRKAIKHGLLPTLFYFLSFCLLTYPEISDFFTHYFADKNDGLQNIWNLWWVDLAIRRPDMYPTIWFTNLLHWPFGTTLFAQTLNPFNGYLTVFLHRFLSLTATYNTIVIFSFVMGGVTMYWLAYYLTKSFWGSLIAGFIFTFSSYHFMHAEGHLQLVSLEWMPLFILCWLSLLDNPKLFTALVAAVSLWLVVLCDYYYFLYCVLTAIFIIIWYAAINKSAWFVVRKKHCGALATFTIASLLLIGPMVGALFLGNYRDPLLGNHNPVNFSLDILALFIPGGHWMFNQWTQFYWSKLPGNIGESSVYLGISVYFILGYVWIKRKKLEQRIEQQVYLWFITFGFFLLMALGPAFQVDGKIIWDKAMPYTLLINVLPFMKLSGLPVRMMIMVIFGASLLCAIGFGELFKQFSHKKIFIIILLGVLVFETLPRPLPATKIEVPDYITALAGLPNDGGVVDLVTNDLTLPLYYQTIHGKPIAFGYVSRLPSSVSVKEVALTKTITDQDYGKLWDTYHIRYIITHDILQAQASEPYMTLKTVYDQNDIRIYRIGCVCENNSNP
jgi:hypothetical protein